MADEPQDRRSGDDRREPDQSKRSAWLSPQLWVSITGLLLTIVALIGTRITTQLDYLITTAAEQKQQAKDFERRIGGLETDNKTQIQINQQIRDRVSRLEGQTSIPQERKP